MVAMLHRVVRLEKPGSGEMAATIGPGKVELVERVHQNRPWLFPEGENSGLPQEVWKCLESAGFLVLLKGQARA